MYEPETVAIGQPLIRFQDRPGPESALDPFVAPTAKAADNTPLYIGGAIVAALILRSMMKPKRSRRRR